MANKEKGNDDITKTAIPEKELNADVVKGQLEGMVEYHNKLVAEKERLIGDINKVETALTESLGGINTLKGLQNEYFVQEVPSSNGEK